MDDTYERLKNLKGKKSFSHILNELMTEKNQNILAFAGALESEWKNRDAKKFVHALREQDTKADAKRSAKLEKHWRR